MLLLFLEKVDSPAMVRHDMNLLKKLQKGLHPGQISIIACDCPIFGQFKYIQ